MNNLLRWWKNEKGVALTEYILIIAIIALVSVIGLSAYGSTMNIQYTRTNNSIDQNVNPDN